MSLVKADVLNSHSETIRVDKLHGVTAPQGPLEGPDAVIVGSTPFHSVKLKDIPLTLINSSVSDESQANFYPLRNYLILRENSKEKDTNIFSLVGGRDKIIALNFFLKVNRDFLRVLSSSLNNPALVVRMEIESIQTFKDIWKMDNLVVKTKTEGVKVSELLPTNQGDLQEACIKLNFEEGTAYAQILTLLHILKCIAGKLKFTWDVQILCEGSPSVFSLPGSGQNWEDDEKDVTIVTANGAEIKCHREILTAQSSTFKSMLSPEFGMLEASSGRIEMKENSEEGILQFIKCLYGLELPLDNLTSDLALELFQLANKYELSQMEQFFKSFLSSKGGEFYSADGLLELYFFARNIDSLEDLKNHSLIELTFLRRKPKNNLESSEYFQRLDRKVAEELRNLLIQWNWIVD